MEFAFTFIELFFWSLYLVLPLLFFLTFMIVLLGQIVCRIEKWGTFDGLYWSFITATTVGYGDFHPLGKCSKALSVVVALLGLILTGIIIAVALNASSFALEKHGDPSVIEVMKKRLN